MSEVLELYKDPKLETNVKDLESHRACMSLIKVQSLFKAYYTRKAFDIIKMKASVNLSELFTDFLHFKNYFMTHINSAVLDNLENLGMHFKLEEIASQLWTGPITNDFTHFYYGETDKQKIPNGSGILLSYSFIYEGLFVDGKFDGRGRMIDYKDGVYDGNWQSGQKHGNGAIFYHNGLKYYGNWINDKKCGKGVMEGQNWVYEGHFENDLRNGYGEQTFRNEEHYRGYYLNGYFEGFGIFIKKSGDKYEGEFKNGIFHGKGKMIMADGTIYLGGFVEGKRWGFATVCTKNIKYETEWRNDKPIGEYKLYKPKNKVSKGVWSKLQALDHMNEVMDNVFLGNHRAATDEDWLKEVGIKNILRILDDENVKFLPGFTYYYVQLKDSNAEDITKYLDGAIEFIDKSYKNKEKLLIHCYAGISRSPAIFIAYLLKKTTKSFDEAYEYVKRYRSNINPNIGFVRQLKALKKNE